MCHACELEEKKKRVRKSRAKERWVPLYKTLARVRPQLIKEWDWDKNGDLTPYNVSYGSGIMVHWKDKYGHEWEARIDSRTSGNGCPYCDGKLVCYDNCLAVLNPKISKEWNYKKNKNLSPYEVTVNSGMKVAWICSNNHEWNARIADRNRGDGCPYCCGKKLCKDNCLFKLSPRVAKEWDYEKNYPLTPYDVLNGSHDKFYWVCSKKHKWQSTVVHRTIRGNNCPYCANRKICKDNSLFSKLPLLSKEWHPTKNGTLTPHDVSISCGKKVHWLCKCGYEWIATIAMRSRGSGCPVCKHKKVVLRCSAVCDSIVEAYFYLLFKDQGSVFYHGQKYPNSNFIYDFYFPFLNKYLEVTGYNEKCRWWKPYYAKILKKKEYVEKILGAKFEFRKIVLNSKQVESVEKNVIRRIK